MKLLHTIALLSLAVLFAPPSDAGASSSNETNDLPDNAADAGLTIENAENVNVNTAEDGAQTEPVGGSDDVDGNDDGEDDDFDGEDDDGE